MLKARIFYDPDREALFIDTVRDAFPPRTLEAWRDGDRIMVSVANSPDITIFGDVYSNIMTRDGRSFDTPQACLAYLQEEFDRTRPMGCTFVQPDPRTVWEIAHTLNFNPNVTVVDSAGDRLLLDVTYVDARNVRLDFTNPTSGTAYLS